MLFGGEENSKQSCVIKGAECYSGTRKERESDNYLPAWPSNLNAQEVCCTLNKGFYWGVGR